MRRNLETAAVIGLIALAAMLVGCGEAHQSSGRTDVPNVKANAESPAEVDRVESRVAFRVSGMKKTASGAT